MEAGCGDFEKQEIKILTRKPEIKITTSRAVISLFRVIYSIFRYSYFRINSATLRFSDLVCAHCDFMFYHQIIQKHRTNNKYMIQVNSLKCI